MLKESDLAPPHAVVTATDETIVAFVRSATERLVVLAPAVSLDVANEVKRRWEALRVEKVSIILDVDAEVYRLGYGDIAALDLLEKTGARLGAMLQQHLGIRIGVIIADDRVLVYTPTPKLIEAGPRLPAAPNAIVLTSTPPELERELGVSGTGTLDQEIGLDKAKRDQIDEVKAELQRNPPRSFDIERRLRVFNAAFRFVELQVLGTQISRRSVEIPTHLLGVLDATTAAQLRTRLRLVPPDHALAGNGLARLRKRITDEYLHVIAGYGTVILRSRESAFLSALKDLEEAVVHFKENALAALEKELAARVDELTKALAPAVFARPPSSHWGLVRPFRDIEEAEAWTRSDLTHAVGQAADYIGAMEIPHVFKEVTYESLTTPAFMDLARASFPDLRELFSEEEAAPVVTNARVTTAS